MWALMTVMLTAGVGANPAGSDYGLPLVVIDPGHGGDQDGAVGVCGIREKDVTLAVSAKLAELMAASKRVEPVLTRRTDRAMNLESRVAMANQLGAAVFVSIHANASTSRRARGVETFFLSNRKVGRSAWQTAVRENEGASPAWEEKGDPLGQILDGLVLGAAHRESQRLAMRLQQTLRQKLHTRGRGVLQAPFVVLKGATMAAALVEVGFLSHPKECRQLGNSSHQHRVAKGLATALLSHISQEEALFARR
jgi:N-acetylmuramoyl-L-alanine amidase